jgi:hypothetical protein
MTEPKKKKKRKGAPAAAERKVAEVVVEQPATADETERSLGRSVAIGLPAVSLIGAVAVGLASNFGSALLVLAAGGLLGAIALFWASMRTLTGDAPLPAQLAAAASTQRVGVNALPDRKRAALRALKDLEAEHAIGKIDDADYAELVAQYREKAKAVLRLMDERVAPAREEAERMAHAYLAKKGLDGEGDGAADDVDAEAPPEREPEAETETATATETAEKPENESSRVKCTACDASNEPDAAFCKQCGKRVKPETKGEAEASDAEA